MPTPLNTHTHTHTHHTPHTHIYVCLCHLFPKNMLWTRSDAFTTVTIQSMINTMDHNFCVNILAVFLGMCGKTDPSSWHLAFSCLCPRQNVEQTPEATQRDRQHHTCPSFPPSTKVMTAAQPIWWIWLKWNLLRPHVPGNGIRSSPHPIFLPWLWAKGAVS